MSDITSDVTTSFYSAARGGARAEVFLNQNRFRVYSPDSSSSSATSTIIQGYGSPTHEQNPPPKKKRKQPGNPDPSAEVIALSPLALMATNRFFCELCHLGFQRDQNLQLHRRSHNLPWNLKVRSTRKKVYMCPVPTCIYHNPARALGDFTGTKKHFLRKHCAKTWQCNKCSKMYAVQSDCKVHHKTCGHCRRRRTRDFECKCGSLLCSGRRIQPVQYPGSGVQIVRPIPIKLSDQPYYQPQLMKFNNGGGRGGIGGTAHPPPPMMMRQGGGGFMPWRSQQK
ncbi:hypothetical protein Dsin_022393 [Dipteronia sinensis]|uniref:C2H2-type domain-containing protein n=1 Tax=Dipteronia sinensis TaxID=43782 RepID=A0AAE0A1N1_9ROSI|nr:hypothetical protein Dsin_022393 [Dipteronia sinensis]